MYMYICMLYTYMCVSKRDYLLVDLVEPSSKDTLKIENRFQKFTAQ